MRISDWSSDVCSSDLDDRVGARAWLDDEVVGFGNADLEFVHFKIAHVLPVRLDHGERNAGDAEVEESHSAAVDDPQPDSLTGRERERSEEHTSELQSTNAHLVCRLLLETKKTNH